MYDLLEKINTLRSNPETDDQPQSDDPENIPSWNSNCPESTSNSILLLLGGKKCLFIRIKWFNEGFVNPMFYKYVFNSAIKLLNIFY